MYTRYSQYNKILGVCSLSILLIFTNYPIINTFKSFTFQIYSIYLLFKQLTPHVPGFCSDVANVLRDLRCRYVLRSTRSCFGLSLAFSICSYVTPVFWYYTTEYFIERISTKLITTINWETVSCLSNIHNTQVHVVQKTPIFVLSVI